MEYTLYGVRLPRPYDRETFHLPEGLPRNRSGAERILAVVLAWDDDEYPADIMSYESTMMAGTRKPGKRTNGRVKFVRNEVRTFKSSEPACKVHSCRNRK